MNVKNVIPVCTRRQPNHPHRCRSRVLALRGFTCSEAKESSRVSSTWTFAVTTDDPVIKLDLDNQENGYRWFQPSSWEQKQEA